MSRNGSGTYSVPNTFVAGTTITAAQHNQNWTDVATAITGSLALDGQSTMTGALNGSGSLEFEVNGTAAAEFDAAGALVFSTATTRDSTPATGSFRWNATSGTPEFYNGTAWDQVFGTPRGYIDGCILSNNATDATNDIDIAEGVCRDATNVATITVAAMTKKLDDNWAAGTNVGMRYSGAAIANTTYHIYAAAKADGTQDIYADPSATAATALVHLQAETGGADYVVVRRIGSILRESAAIVRFVQDGDYFQRKALKLDLAANNPGTGSDVRTLSVPTGIKVLADIYLRHTNAGTSGPSFALLTDIDTDGDTPDANNTQTSNASTSGGGVQFAPAILRIRTNTSAQIRSQASYSDGNVTMLIVTRGWFDARGKQ